MKQYLKVDPWKIIESRFDPLQHRSSESIFSLGNGYMGQRANFEECYTGSTLQGTYIGGIYYTDKTRVGWWKNGYPDYFARVLNAPYWTGVRFLIDDKELDLAQCEVVEFERTLDMKQGVLERRMVLRLSSGKMLAWYSRRFLSMKIKEVACISIRIEALNFTGKVRVISGIDGGVRNEDANYGEVFWEVQETLHEDGQLYLRAQTRKTHFTVAVACTHRLFINQEEFSPRTYDTQTLPEALYHHYEVELGKGQSLEVEKYVSVYHSMNHDVEAMYPLSTSLLTRVKAWGFITMLDHHVLEWQKIWDHADIEIDGDEAAQQGIRFNIYQLHQTYRGDDSRLNIGPKGFTGEKYGGSTYWDTEAYCLPFFLATAPSKIAKNLLIYRYKQLGKAIENASKLGFSNGAALYPMVTMNGEECHNEWEITFEEIHRNGAIAFAIYRYINYTGDQKYLLEGGLEVLLGIARFWGQRFTFSQDKQRYVMLGVTGPNEYENNVNNNWYTNTIAAWCLRYAIESIDWVKEQDEALWGRLSRHIHFDERTELKHWHDILNRLYLPYDEQRGVFLQQDGYLDKELLTVKDLDSSQRPINQHWSWDRILRSCYIKQADVLQGIYFFEPTFSQEEIQRNFDFYEPRTVHESSLSPCIHVVLAATLNRMDRAYELYLNTSRLDLDDYNQEVHEGLHITSMAGTWMSVVEGFGGMRVKEGRLCFTPRIPAQWSSFSFVVMQHKVVLQVTVTRESIKIIHKQGDETEVDVYGQAWPVRPSGTVEVQVPREIY